MNEEGQAGRRQPVPMHRLGFVRALIRYGAISALIGVGIQLFLSLDDARLLQPRALLAGALLGSFLCVGSLTAEALLLRLLPRASRERGFLLQAVAYFVGGMAGLLLASLVTETLLGVRLLGASRLYTVAAFGGLSAVIGLTFATIGRLRYRLEKSVAELKEKEFAAKELETAREIQQRLLPPPDARGEGFRIAARNRAARVVAGDFYDVFRLGDGALGIAIADVVGKGLGAALIMASVKAILPLVAAERGVAEALGELNRRLAGELGPREFVALAYARFEPETGRLELANAGLPDPLRLVPGRRPEEVAAPGERLPLGVRVPVEYSSVVVDLGVGERLLLHTDGLVEARRDGELLGFDGLDALVGELEETEPGAFLDALMEQIERFGGGGLDDDCTAVLLERIAGLSPPEAVGGEGL